MDGSKRQDDPLTRKIIGAAIEVHRRLGPGLLESTYETCFCYELNFIGLKVKRQIPVPIVYRETKLDSGYRIDMVIEEEVIVEIKSVASLLPVHEAQLLSYLKHNGGGRGLLFNFNVKLLKTGIKRLIV
jgi:GxxExxY protein